MKYRILSFVSGSILSVGINIFILTGAAFAQGGSPLITNDTGTPGANKWEINFGATAEHTKEEKVYALPFLNTNYGIGERIQLKYELGWILHEEKSGETKRGLGNSVAGLKWRFHEAISDQFALSVYPQLAFNNPTRSVEIGIADKGVNLLLPIEADLRFGSLSFSFETGYFAREFDADGWILGGAAGHGVSENFQVLGEIFSVFTDAEDDQRILLNIGSKVKLTSSLLLINSFGTSLRQSRNSDPQFIGYLALLFRT